MTAGFAGATSSTALPPLVPGLPVLGCALDMRINPLEFLTRMYQQYGPVFRVRILNRTHWVIAGSEGNRFMSSDGGEHLGSTHVYGEFGREFGADLLIAMDGPQHRQLRKVQRPGYSREAIVRHLPAIEHVARESIAGWRPGESRRLLPLIREVVFSQLGALIAGPAPCGLLGDMEVVFDTNLMVNVSKILPKVALRLPHYRRARMRVDAFIERVVNWHRHHPPLDREPDLVDRLLAAEDLEGQPYDEQSVKTSVLGFYVSGLHTLAASATFLIGAVLGVPGLQAQIAAEADQAFDEGELTLASLQGMTTLHKAALETMRRYTVSAFLPRSVITAFEFEGFRFEAGTQVLVAEGVTHLLPENFPNPLAFAPDRESWNGAAPPSDVYTPYSLGAHSCLGARVADVQLRAVAGVMFHELELAFKNPNTPLSVHIHPVSGPSRRLQVTAVRRRVH
ncbi:MAG: cytochrome [Frankiales bacterium]|nr:cytochrome [Frankiales bacterium]